MTSGHSICDWMNKSHVSACICECIRLCSMSIAHMFQMLTFQCDFKDIIDSCFIKINCIKNLYFNLQPSFVLESSENIHTATTHMSMTKMLSLSSSSDRICYAFACFENVHSLLPYKSKKIYTLIHLDNGHGHGLMYEVYSHL